jgi:hypothetical protein
VVSHLLQRADEWGAFRYGTLVTAFLHAVAAGVVALKWSCSRNMYLALFGGPALTPEDLPAVRGCIVAGAWTVVMGSIGGGIAAYGATKGWVQEGQGASIGTRDSAIFYDQYVGLTHHADYERHEHYQNKYGSLLEKHNTTLAAVTWLERSDSHNHTGTPFEGLNMTYGRLLTLNDNGILRTSFGHVDDIDEMFDAFGNFKADSVSETSVLTPRVDTSSYKWMSFNTYGENMKLGNNYLGNVEAAVGELECLQCNPNPIYSDYVTNFGNYVMGLMKFCMGVGGGQNAQRAIDSIIVGEIYWNAYGGIDTICQSG